MQIVMKLAGYTLGRSDLVRRAMSKKKADVMAKERQYFVYGNEELGVPGCIARGIPEATANKIFDDMTDFAKYAFNKSHAAAYAVVAYQTAFLKCYYPVEFMAALMSSVKDNSSKVAGYIQSCRQMGIQILPPGTTRNARALPANAAVHSSAPSTRPALRMANTPLRNRYAPTAGQYAPSHACPPRKHCNISAKHEKNL